MKSDVAHRMDIVQLKEMADRFRAEWKTGYQIEIHFLLGGRGSDH